MAYEIDTLDVSLLAAGDLSSYQYCFVKLSANNTVDVCGKGEACFGVLQNKPSVAGQAARVRVFGVSRISSAAAITYGQKVGSEASGQGVAMTLDKDIFAGICISGSTALNELATVLLTGQQTLSV